MEHMLFVARGQSTTLLDSDDTLRHDDSKTSSTEHEQDEYEEFSAHAEE